MSPGGNNARHPETFKSGRVGALCDSCVPTMAAPRERRISLEPSEPSIRAGVRRRHLLHPSGPLRADPRFRGTCIRRKEDARGGRELSCTRVPPYSLTHSPPLVCIPQKPEGRIGALRRTSEISRDLAAGLECPWAYKLHGQPALSCDARGGKKATENTENLTSHELTIDYLGDLAGERLSNVA